MLAWPPGSRRSAPMLMMMSKIFSTLMTMVTKTTVSTGASIGIVTRRNVCHSVAPSTCAASRTCAVERGQAGAEHDHGEAGPDPQVGEDHRDVDERHAEQRLGGLAEIAGRGQRLRAQPEGAREARCEVGGLDLDVEVPGADVGETEAARRRRWCVVAAVRRRRLLIRARRRLGSPSSPGKTQVILVGFEARSPARPSR